MRVTDPNSHTPLEQHHAQFFWTKLWNIMWEASYQHELSQETIRRLGKWSAALSYTSATTAAGSPIVGLAFWETTGGRVAFAALASISAVASFIQARSSSAERVKQESASRREFFQILSEAERWRDRLTKPADLKPSVQQCDSKAEQLDSRLEKAISERDVHVFQLLLKNVESNADSSRRAYFIRKGLLDRQEPIEFGKNSTGTERATEDRKLGDEVSGDGE